MSARKFDSRPVWLLVGILAGLAIAMFRPHDSARAVATDRDSRFAITTIPVKDVTIAGFRDTLDGVFVLDFLTGRLDGAVLNNKNGKFYHRYYRNLSADFNLDPEATPHFAIVSGTTGLPSARGATMANGTIYVGELSSGKVIAYAFPYNDANRPLPPIELTPVDFFQFRESLKP